MHICFFQQLHRATIYNQRQELLEKADVHDEVWQYVENELGALVAMFVTEDHASRNIDGLIDSLNVMLQLSDKAMADIKATESREKIQELVLAEAQRIYKAKEAEAGEESFRQAERAVLLRVIDILWVEHLDAMMKLREAIGLHGYGQRDPLVEYKQEAYNMFQRLQGAIGYDVARLMYKVKIVNTAETAPKAQKAVEKLEEMGPAEPTGDFVDEAEDLEEIAGMAQNNPVNVMADKVAPTVSKADAGMEPMTKENFKQTDPKDIGRNDPCWCGSGLKYKKCHGK
jgi:preprotein translocase subunit SecA